MGGLTIERALRPDEQKLADALARGKYVVTERLVRTRDGKIVREDQAFDGGSFLYGPGTEIPLEEARALGLAPATDAPAEPAATSDPATEDAPAAAPTTTTAPRARRGKGK